MSNYADFIKKLKKVSEKRKHKILNSHGVREAFLYYRKVRPKESKFVLADIEYFKIIRTVNNKLKDQLLQGNDVTLPERMGKLEVRKTNRGISLSNGKVKCSYPINWDKTLKLWYEDEEAYNDRVLVREESKDVYLIYYNKYNANYNNKSYYQFSTNRDLKVKLKEQIKNNKIDAYLYGKKLY